MFESLCFWESRVASYFEGLRAVFLGWDDDLGDREVFGEGRSFWVGLGFFRFYDFGSDLFSISC